MSTFIRDAINSSILNQVDDATTTPVSFRLPLSLSNQLDELSITLDRSKSFLVTEFIKAGVKETNGLLEEKGANPTIECIDDVKDSSKLKMSKRFMLNTNYNNNPESHFEMLKNKEAAAFCNGWKEYIQQLSDGDIVYLYQSGVGFIASGKVTGGLIKGDYKGISDDKYSKLLNKFKVGFKAISAKEFKKITGDGANFRRTMVELTSSQAYKLDNEIKIRIKNTPEI